MDTHVSTYEPLVSVIIPIFRVEKYLRRCVESVLAQTYPKVEVILVDDGSPDLCPEICDAYARTNPSVRVLHKPNGGLSDARNAGLNLAKGKYIYFLDGDDYIEKNLLFRTVSVMLNENADLVAFNYHKIDDEEAVFESSKFTEGTFIFSNDEDRLSYIIDYYCRYTHGWEAWSRLYDGDLIRNRSLRFWDTSEILAEDIGFNLLTLLYAKKLIVVNDVLYNYRIREDSLYSQGRRTFSLPKFIALARKIEEYLSHLPETSVLRTCSNCILLEILLFELGKGNLNEQKHRIASELTSEEASYFSSKLREVLHKRNQCGRFRDKTNLKQAVLHALYYLGGTSFSGSLLGLPLWFSITLRKLSRKGRRINRAIRAILTYRLYPSFAKRSFLLGSEDYGNLGDHQIAESEKELLAHYLPKYHVVEVPASAYHNVRTVLSCIVKRQDLIFLTGGGNIGDVYEFANKIRHDALRRFPNNRITVFPQTIFFESSLSSSYNPIAKLSSDIDKHTSFVLCLREAESLEFAKRQFHCKAVMLPDVVLYTKKDTYPKELREGILLCLRGDHEGILAHHERRAIHAIARSITSGIKEFDTQLKRSVSLRERSEELRKALSLFGASRLVVTDRLHGMVFSAITGTPCVVLRSYSHKIPGVYEWIRHLPYIRLCDGFTELEQNMHELYDYIGVAAYDNGEIRRAFDVFFESFLVYTSE